MLIRKLFRFENAHIVRNCSSQRCSRSIHGHSYQIEIILEAHALDNGQMVYDFGLLKGHIKDLIDSFDHAIAFWDKDDAEYIAYCKKFKDPSEHFAARFCAKEALVKASNKELLVTDIHVVNDEQGAPKIKIWKDRKSVAKFFNTHEIMVSLSHTSDMAMACVLIQKIK